MERGDQVAAAEEAPAFGIDPMEGRPGELSTNPVHSAGAAEAQTPGHERFEVEAELLEEPPVPSNEAVDDEEREDLTLLTIAQLKARAIAEGASQRALDDAQDAENMDDVKDGLLALVRELQPKRVRATTIAMAVSADER